MSKSKNWFEELPLDKQMEYCSRLKGKRRSKYCTFEGKPKAGLKAAAPVEEPKEEIIALASEKQELKLLLEEGLVKPEDIMRETEKKYYDFDSDYEWAKKSDVQNIGEDIDGSARHTRNALKNWDEKDLLVNLNIKINRSALEKKTCPDFAMADGKDLLKAYALREALNEFPKTVPAGNEKDGDDLLLARRKQYLDAYKSTIEKIRGLLADEKVDARQALEQMREHYADLYRKHREPESRLFGDAMYARYRRIYGTNGPMMKLEKAARMIAQTKGTTSPYTRVDLKNLELNDNDKTLLRNLINGKEKLIKRRAPIKNGLDERDIYKNNKSFSIEGKHKVRNEDDALKFMKSHARGVQFGNAMPDNERKVHLVAAAKSLEDLSNATGVSVPSLMQGGKVALAFGARGRSMAAAHYEPGQKVINMTRTSGYGSLAHELGHALDDYAGQIAARGGYLSKASAAGDSDPIQKSFSGVANVIENMRKRIADSDKYRSMTPKQKNYWVSRHEVFARLFEGYVQRKLKKKGTQNSYLVNVPEQISGLWPNEDELKQVESDMDEFLRHYDQAARKVKTPAA